MNEFMSDLNNINKQMEKELHLQKEISILEKYKLFKKEVYQALCNCLDEEDESFALDNVEKAYNKLIKLLEVQND